MISFEDFDYVEFAKNYVIGKYTGVIPCECDTGCKSCTQGKKLVICCYFCVSWRKDKDCRFKAPEQKCYLWQGLDLKTAWYKVYEIEQKEIEKG